MLTNKELFQNTELRCGGFYELCIQVCPSINNKPIELYTNYLWSQKNIDGPYDDEFNKIPINIKNSTHEGILNLETYSIPFKTINIREQAPIEGGFNWFNIVFYTSTLDYVLDLKNQHWTDMQTRPTIINIYLIEILKKLYTIYPFELSFIDFEISGQYYLENLKTEFENWTNTKFFVGKSNSNAIKDEYKKFVIIIN